MNGYEIQFTGVKTMNNQLLQQATNLNINEQIELVEAIWDNMMPHHL